MFCLQWQLTCELLILLATFNICGLTILAWTYISAATIISQVIKYYIAVYIYWSNYTARWVTGCGMGLGHFGDAVSATLFWWRCFGDGMFQRWWSQMFHTKKVCFWNTSMVMTTKDVCLISIFVVMVRVGVVSFLPEVWKSLLLTWSCVKGNMACDISFCWHEAFVSLHKS